MAILACLLAVTLGAAPPARLLTPVALFADDNVVPRAIALSADGSTLVAVGREVSTAARDRPGRLCLWNTADGKTRFSSGGGAGRVEAAAFDPRTGGLYTFASWRLWHRKPDGSEAGDYEGWAHGWAPMRLAVSAGRVTACGPANLAVWDAATGVRIATRRTLVSGDHVGAVSADGLLWAHLNHQDIDLYAVDTRKRVRSFLGHEGRVRAAAFRADGTQLAALSRRLDDGGESHTTAYIHDVEGKRLAAVRLPAGLVGQGVALTPDGRLLAALCSLREKPQACLLLIDPRTGGEAARVELAPSAGYPVMVEASRDGRLLAVALERGVRLYRIGKGTP